jgi:hypothetical protein
MLPADEDVAVCVVPWGWWWWWWWWKPLTEVICGGGSAADADVVNDDSGCSDTGVDASRSEYAMNDSRFCACVGEGGIAVTGTATGSKWGDCDCEWVSGWGAGAGGDDAGIYGRSGGCSAVVVPGEDVADEAVV